jgi:DNA-binding phage protein
VKDFLEQEDVVALLREEVDKAGGQVAWSKKTGVDRTNLNRILNGHIPPTKAVMVALKLRLVYARDAQSAGTSATRPARRLARFARMRDGTS